ISTFGDCALADAIDLRGVKPFDNIAGESAILGESMSARRFGKQRRDGPVRLTGRIGAAEDTIDALPEVVHAGKATMGSTPMLSDNVHRGELCRIGNLAHFFRFAMKEFRPQLDWQSRACVSHGKNPAADTSLRLEYDDSRAFLAE